MPHPLHPAVVHFPLVLAVLLPFVAGVALLASRRASSGRGPWMAVAAMAVLLSLSAWVAVETGQGQEETVEGVVSEGAIHQHEEAAEGLLLGSVLIAGLILSGLAPGRVGKGARYISVPAALVVLALAFRVGDSGGGLVYTHGAAAAYVGNGGGDRHVQPPSRSDEDDEEHERR
ncbi:MAG: hypothetical protein PVJ02_16370 [Gemmatimonadota bacterium]|jgi:uncharacterized membrane protein